jgi:hypothetical protein
VDVFAAELCEDFVQKLKVCFKELRETRRRARLIKREAWAANDPNVAFILSECDELIRIFFSSIQTAQRMPYCRNVVYQALLVVPRARLAETLDVEC